MTLVDDCLVEYPSTHGVLPTLSVFSIAQEGICHAEKPSVSSQHLYATTSPVSDKQTNTQICGRSPQISTQHIPSVQSQNEASPHISTPERRRVLTLHHQSCPTMTLSHQDQTPKTIQDQREHAFHQHPHSSSTDLLDHQNEAELPRVVKTLHMFTGD